MAIVVVGIGSGRADMMTQQAQLALESADVIVGYDVYIELIRPYCRDKTVVSSGMRQEIKRCEEALAWARKGASVAVVSSGDAAVYGMAGLLLELAEKAPDLDIQVVPGVTAALSASAVLGAPLGHDFAVVSLSDLLTPWEVIEKRVTHSAMADFILCLYNPKSQKRTWQIRRVAELLLNVQPPSIPCGWVKNIGREGEQKQYFTLATLAAQDIDMFTTVIIGNRQSKMVNGRLVTPRGYGLEAQS